MKYKEIEDIFSAKRMQKYVLACGGDTRRAMTLYRYNLKLSQEMFTLVSCFEVALRNRIDKQMIAYLGNDWLRDLVMPGGNKSIKSAEIFGSFRKTSYLCSVNS